MSKLHRGFFSTLNRFSEAIQISPKKPESAVNDLNADLKFLNNQDARQPGIQRSPALAGRKNLARNLFLMGCIQGLLGVHQAYAATYYVSPSGSDSNNGTALSTPVKTINKALSKARSSGDIVYVTTGTYAETPYIDQSGITLSAYQDNKPVIDGGNSLPNGDWSQLIAVTGNNNKVSGFEVKNCNINGSYAGGYGIVLIGHHNTISKMNVHHIWSVGVISNGDYNIVEDSQIWQASYSHANGNGGGWASGLSAARNGSSDALKQGINSYTTFRRNTVFNNWGEGLSCYEADHCTVEDNIVYDNWATNMYLSDATNSVMQRNLVYISSNPIVPSPAQRGITLSDEVASVPRSANNTIINNFIYNAVLDAFSWTEVDKSGLNNVLIANNTIVDGDLFTGGGSAIVNINSQIRNNIITGKNNSVPSAGGLTFSHNNWGTTPSAAAASTNIVGDPQIARTGSTAPGALTSAYFKIGGSSPVVDRAMVISTIPSDFFKTVRGSTPDIGGDEVSAAGGGNTSDTTAPSAPAGLGGTASASTKVNLTWTASTDNVGVTAYKIYRNGTEIGTNAGTRFADSAVVAGTSYSYTVKAQDAAGNLSAVSNTATVKTPTSTGTAVSLSSYSVGTITRNSAIVKWSTNVSSTGKVLYGTSAGSLGSQVTAGNAATNQSVQVSGLARRTTYYYQVSVTNGSTTALSPVASFTTARW